MKEQKTLLTTFQNIYHLPITKLRDLCTYTLQNYKTENHLRLKKYHLLGISSIHADYACKLEKINTIINLSHASTWQGYINRYLFPQDLRLNHIERAINLQLNTNVRIE